MLAYQLTLGEVIIVILFWGTESNQDDPLTQLWATLIASAVRFVLALFSVRAFDRAKLPEEPVREDERTTRPPWTGSWVGIVLEKVLTRIPFVGERLFGFMIWCSDRSDGHPGWLLVLRQTAPPLTRQSHPSKQRRPGARASLAGESAGGHVVSAESLHARERKGMRVSPQCDWWTAPSSSVLLTDPTASQFCSDLLRYVPNRFRLAASGQAKFKLVCYGKPGWLHRGRRLCTIVWKQAVDTPPLAPLADARRGDDCFRAEGFEVLQCSGPVGAHINPKTLHALQRLAPSDSETSSPMGLMALSHSPGGHEPSLVLGQAAPDESGGLVGCRVGEGAPVSFHRVELHIFLPSAQVACQEPDDADDNEATVPSPSLSPPPSPPSPSLAPAPSPPQTSSDHSKPPGRVARVAALDMSNTQRAVRITEPSDVSHGRRTSNHSGGRRTSTSTGRRSSYRSAKAVAKRATSTVKVVAQYAVESAEEKAAALADAIGTASESVVAARARWKRGDLVELSQVPISAVVWQSDGTVGFFYDDPREHFNKAPHEAKMAVHRHKAKMATRRLSQTTPVELMTNELSENHRLSMAAHMQRAQRATSARGSLMDADALFGLVGDGASDDAHKLPRPPPHPSPPASPPCTTSTHVPTREGDFVVPPRYVAIERLRRERRCRGLLRTDTVTLTYSLTASAQLQVRLRQLVHPSDAHVRLAQWYEALVAGAERTHHRQAISHMLETVSLVPGWRDALTPFCRGFEPRRLALGWRLNYGLLIALLALLVMDFITLRDTLPFGEIGLTLLYGFFAEPMLAALLLLVEIVQIFFALAVLRKLLSYTGLQDKLIQLFDDLSARKDSISSRFSKDCAALRSSSWDEGGALGSGSSGPERLSRRASSSTCDAADGLSIAGEGDVESAAVAAPQPRASVRRSGSSILRRGYSVHKDEEDSAGHVEAGSIEMSASVESPASPGERDSVLGGVGVSGGAKVRRSTRGGSLYSRHEDEDSLRF